MVNLHHKKHGKGRYCIYVFSTIECNERTIAWLEQILSRPTRHRIQMMFRKSVSVIVMMIVVIPFDLYQTGDDTDLVFGVVEPFDKRK